MTPHQARTLSSVCRRFGCVFRRRDYRLRRDGYVEGWCGGSPASGVWLVVHPLG